MKNHYESLNNKMFKDKGFWITLRWTNQKQDLSSTHTLYVRLWIMVKNIFGFFYFYHLFVLFTFRRCCRTHISFFNFQTTLAILKAKAPAFWLKHSLLTPNIWNFWRLFCFNEHLFIGYWNTFILWFLTEFLK